ncbi:uncharacterized conserved protein [Aeropyrum camini SY1 = JCM 12091]|uniref:Uncharacterized conserved protein n=1 Tax=Aeropyrum camini SY1 = JCM 12091 TaxID=1198449 RepID=U3TG64_9CREN|nr:uncharacterized conserved protein [Aeropyrum camini SY1 = JCM 12091]
MDEDLDITRAIHSRREPLHDPLDRPSRCGGDFVDPQPPVIHYNICKGASNIDPNPKPGHDMPAGVYRIAWDHIYHAGGLRPAQPMMSTPDNDEPEG